MLREIVEAKDGAKEAIAALRKQMLAPESILDVKGVNDLKSFKKELDKWVAHIKLISNLDEIKYWDIIVKDYKNAYIELQK